MFASYVDMLCTKASLDPILDISTCVAARRAVSDFVGSFLFNYNNTGRSDLSWIVHASCLAASNG